MTKKRKRHSLPEVSLKENATNAGSGVTRLSTAMIEFLIKGTTTRTMGTSKGSTENAITVELLNIKVQLL